MCIREALGVLLEEGEGEPMAMVGAKGIDEGKGEAITMVGRPGEVYSSPGDTGGSLWERVLETGVDQSLRGGGCNETVGCRGGAGMGA